MSHYFDRKQTTPALTKTISINLFAKTYEFETASATFSWYHLDIATKLLLISSNLADVKTLLDLGCGWGPVAIILKDQKPELEVTAVDISERAVEFTARNAQKHKLDIDVRQSNLFANCEKTFDCILTNPPYSAGRDECYRFVEESYQHLNTGGSLQLVARHQRGGKMLEARMKELFGNVETLGKSAGFRVYKSVKQ